jgi:RNase P subunit RPR2
MKIIQEGSLRRRTCSECQTLFEYDENDIIKDIVDYGYTVDLELNVKCPLCGYIIYLGKVY